MNLCEFNLSGEIAIDASKLPYRYWYWYWAIHPVTSIKKNVTKRDMQCQLSGPRVPSEEENKGDGKDKHDKPARLKYIKMILMDDLSSQTIAAQAPRDLNARGYVKTSLVNTAFLKGNFK